MIRWKAIAYSGGLETTELDAIVGLVLIALVLEAARRGIGLMLAVIGVAFFIYPFISEYLPGVLHDRGYSVLRISEYLSTTGDGLYGIPIGVSASFIILFTIYGAFLSEFGAGEFFFKLSDRVTSGTRAAAAKTAVIFSTLLGMISGSAAGNVAVTGTLTIPMMKREGYAPHQAAAIEAVVSTGGQMMPPVMGAAAFVMAELIGIEYRNIMIAALVPALLFFATIYIVVHLQAVKNDIQPAPPSTEIREPLWKLLLSGGQFIVPFVTLIGLMVVGYSPFKASFASMILLVVMYVIWMAVGERRFDTQIHKKIVRAIIDGSTAVVPIAVACAVAGVIAGTLGISGLGAKISGLIIDASGGIVIVALLLTMVAALILGMGLPTTAAYLILATVVAPSLVKMGIPVLSAHMFVFFFGCVSTITPPVALASYVAAGIANADINKVGWTAFFYGITSFILPFMFIYGPGLLLQGEWPDITVAVISGFVGIFCIASAVVGYLRNHLAAWQRVALFLAGLTLMHQGWMTNAVGLLVLGAIWLLVKPRAAALVTGNSAA
jgi:TRAP transporter 4TM/12TM fusion protein